MTKAKAAQHNNVVGDELGVILAADRQQRWWRTPHLVRLNAILGGLLLYSSTVGYDGSLMNGLQSLTQWKSFMNHPSGAWLGFINAMQCLGALTGLVIQPWAANRFGRRPCLFVGYGSLILGAGLQAGARNPGMFIVSRFFIGHAAAWFQPALLLITELAYPTHRPKMSSMFMCMYYVGSLIAAWSAFGCRNYQSNWAWRIPSLLQIVIPLAALPAAIASPESPRWLIAQDRHEEARAILAKYHAAEGQENSSLLVSFELEEIGRSIALERQAQNSTKWTDMLKTKGNRHRFLVSATLGVFAQWNGVGIVSYYLTLILDTIGVTGVTEQTLINGFLQLWNLIVAISAACLVDRAGRRSLFIASTVIMLISYIIITGLSGSFTASKVPSVGTAVIPFLFIYYGGYDIAFTPLVMSYPAEIWPFSLRARGLALTTISTYLALLFNLFVNSIAMDAISWKYYILYICLLVIILVTVILCYPETRGHTLEEIAVVFDGKDAAVPSEDEVFGKIGKIAQLAGEEKRRHLPDVELVEEIG